MVVKAPYTSIRRTYHDLPVATDGEENKNSITAKEWR